MKRIDAVSSTGGDRPRFTGEEWVGGFPCGLTAGEVQRLAMVFAAWLRERPRVDDMRPRVGLAVDGRSMSAVLVAAASEGARAGGCDVLDNGAATSASLVEQLHVSRADGGLLVGNVEGAVHRASIRLWGPGGCPLNTTDWETIERRWRGEGERRVRSAGRLLVAALDAAYLAALGRWFHGLRPLTVAIRTAPGVWCEQLRQLTRSTACEVVPWRESVSAHCSLEVVEDGEAWRVYDERGQSVPPHGALLLVLGALSKSQPLGNVVISGLPRVEIDRLAAAHGFHVHESGPSRAEVHVAIERHDAVLAGDAVGRIWFNTRSTGRRFTARDRRSFAGNEPGRSAAVGGGWRGGRLTET